MIRSSRTLLPLALVLVLVVVVLAQIWKKKRRWTQWSSQIPGR